jgi:flagellar motility protein MotE (MotC chaperone)
VTRIYESMRPEEAAQILDQLDDETLRVVFAKMDPKQIASIMASMSRERAVAFTKTLATDPETARTAAR